MKTETIGMCVVALLLGMLLANMLKDVCGCNVVEGNKDHKKKHHKSTPSTTLTVSHDRAKGHSTISVAAGNSNVS